MVLRIRLARFGKKHAPFYNIVVAHARYVCKTLGSSQILNCSSVFLTHTLKLPTPPMEKTREQKKTCTCKCQHLKTNSSTSTARNSRPLEVLGTYDPKPQAPRPGDTYGRAWKDIKLDVARARYWVGVGAQPSDTAWRILSMVGILEPQYRVGQIQGQVVKADSAFKSLVEEKKEKKKEAEAES